MKSYQSINAEEVHAPEHDFPTSRQNDNTHPQDHLAPPFDSDERPSNLFVGTFNLIASMVGGGVLTLPIVFEKCGVAFSTLAMILSACMTHASLVMFCHCSRRGGGSSYGEVVRSAFGETMEKGVSWLLFVFLMFVIVAYMILIRDIWTPLVREVLQIDVGGDYVLLAITILLLPLLCQRSLHALRYNCYVGCASIFALCVALCRGGLQRLKFHPPSIFDSDNGNGMETIEDDNSSSFTVDFFKIPSSQEILFSFPIVTLAFLCHFNIIAIQNALQKPSRKRMQNLTQYGIGTSFLLMQLFGLGGYLYAGASTKGNILLNVPMGRRGGADAGEYYLFLLGRIGYGITIMLAMPLMALPCRESLLEVIDVWFHHSHHLADETSDDPTAPNEQCGWAMLHRCDTSETVPNHAITTEDEITEILPGDSENEHPVSSVLIRHDPIQRDYIFRNALAHYGSTLLIVTTCYLGAVAVDGVAVVWSFIGSSMAFIIAFVLPCGCFIVIETAVPTSAEGGDREDRWIQLAWVMLLFSLIGTVVCTANNIVGFVY